MLVKKFSLSRVANSSPTTLLAKKCASHTYFWRFSTSSVKLSFWRAFYLTASTETYLFTRAKKKGNSHLLIRDDAFSSGILNLILMNDTKKTYALYLLTFTLTTRSLNQKNDFCIYKNNQSCHYWNKLVFSVFYKSKYFQMTFFTHAREAFAIRLFKKLYWFIFLRRKIGKNVEILRKFHQIFVTKIF